MHIETEMILAQSPRPVGSQAKPPPGRSHFYWLLAALSAPLFGIVTAFGVAPKPDHIAIPLKTVVESIELPQLAVSPPAAAPQRYWREERVQRGDTVAGLLSRLGVDDPAAVEFLRANRDARSLHQLRPGRSVSAIIGEGGELQSMRYAWGKDMAYVVEREGNGFRVDERALALQPRVLMKSGEIRSSLFAATDLAGIPDGVSAQMAEIFGGDIDFHRDLRRGDHFTVVYEMLEDAGEFVRSGRVLAAEFVNQGQAYRAIYFEDAERHGGYYAADGKNLKKAFLRSPLEFSRISSGFTSSRFHPIMQKWRAHRGVDYAAPTGTGVRATADGVVEFIGVQGGYGKVVALRHQGRVSTWYGHLSRFAGGIRAGVRVSQGQVVGFVGATGWATGPHLHYEFRVAGVQANPLAVVLPPAPPLNGAALAQFRGAATPLLERLYLLRNTNLALLE